METPRYLGSRLFKVARHPRFLRRSNTIGRVTMSGEGYRTNHLLLCFFIGCSAFIACYTC